MRRFGAIGTTFWPRVRAQRAFCAAEILARAAALILRGPCDTPVLSNPLSAPIAVSNAFIANVRFKPTLSAQRGYGSVNVLLNVPSPSLVVTPFSKKQPPPNETPTV